MLQEKGGHFVCVTTEGESPRKISRAVISPRGEGKADLPAVVDGSRLIPPCPPSWLKWLQLDTSLDLDVNRVCKLSPSLPANLRCSELSLEDEATSGRDPESYPPPSRIYRAPLRSPPRS